MSTFTFDAAGLDAAITDWRALRDDLEAQQSHVQELRQLAAQSPAGDEMTAAFVASAQSAAGAADVSAKDLLTYIDGFIGKLVSAKRDYVSADVFNIVLD